MKLWRLAGIAFIAIVVFRLWDIPVSSGSTTASDGNIPVWMQFVAYSIIQIIIATRAQRNRSQIVSVECRHH
jgi:hypothetical protein